MKTIQDTKNIAGNVSSMIRDRAGALGSFMSEEGSELSHLAAERADEARRYLVSRGPAGVGKDLVSVARKHPVIALTTALGLGYLVSRMLRD